MSIPSGLSAATGLTGSLESILGPLLIGILFSAALWGITCVQTYDYFMTTPNEDLLWHKLIVALLWIIDTFDTVMSSHVLYHYLVKNFANPYAFISTTWSLSCRALLNVDICNAGVNKALSSFIVRAMFARRLYLVSRKNLVLTVWIMAMSTAHFVTSTLVTVKSFIGLDSTALPDMRRLLYLSFSFGLVSDASVTLALSWLLLSAKTGIRSTDTLVKVLILYAVTTGLLVFIDNALGLIFYHAMPKNLVYIAFYVLLGKLYTNAFLASLNGRPKLRKTQTDISIPLSRLHHTGQNRFSTLMTVEDKSFAHNSTVVTVETSTERITDHPEVMIKNYHSADVL